MSQPPQDPTAYPWGAREPHGASPLQPPAPAPDPAPAPAVEPQAGDGHTGTPYTGTPYTGTPYTGTPYAATSSPGALTGYQGEPHGGSTGGSAPTSTVVLVAISAVSLVTGAFTLAGIAGLVLGIVALVRAGTDLPAARRLTRIGWIIWAVVAVLTVLLVVGAIVLFAAASDGFSSGGPVRSPGLSTAFGLG